MTRISEYESLYKAFDEFLSGCILDNGCLLWPGERIWTAQNVADVKHRMIDTSIPGSDLSFEEKLQQQMQGASREQWMLLCDVYYVYYLPSYQIRLETRQESIEWAARQGGVSPLPKEAEVWEAQKEGFSRTGYRYHQKYLQFWLILLFADHVKSLPDPQAAVKNPLRMQEILDGLLDSIPTKNDRAYGMRHAMLYLAFPEEYERIISTADKERIVKAFGGRIAGDVPEDLDEAIRYIREALSEEYDDPDGPFGFYDQKLRRQWKPPTSRPPDDEVPPPEDPPALPDEVSVILTILKRTRNVILHGPPGTGKTYIAQKVAAALAGSADGVYWTTFHQSYAYEDFVEGLRPITRSDHPGDVSYEVVPGVFRRICTEAEENPGQVYVLVIDEINRGNMAKILGELITLIEDDKRAGKENALSVILPYSGHTFSVPSNLYLVGTMNTADRSIALLDVALRRRFAFVELMPLPALLGNAQVESQETVVPLASLLRSLNLGIRQYLDRDHQIGHSYLLKAARASEEERAELLEFAWNNQILPLLEEYFYGQRDKLVELLAPFRTEVESKPGARSEMDDIEIGRLEGDDLLAALARLAEMDTTGMLR